MIFLFICCFFADFVFSALTYVSALASFACDGALQACFEDLVQFMSSGPSHVLVLSQVEGSGGVVPAWRQFIGPADTEEAKREKPERLVTGNSTYDPVSLKTSRQIIISGFCKEQHLFEASPFISALLIATV